MVQVVVDRSVPSLKISWVAVSLLVLQPLSRVFMSIVKPDLTVYFHSSAVLAKPWPARQSCLHRSVVAQTESQNLKGRDTNTDDSNAYPASAHTVCAVMGGNYGVGGRGHTRRWG